MLLPEEIDTAHCLNCGGKMPANPALIGPERWQTHEWTCRHPKTFTCPDCVKNYQNHVCPVCFCQEEYT